MSPDTPLREAVAQWLATYCAQQQRERTYALTARRVAHRLLPWLGPDRAVASFTKDDLHAFAARLKADGLTPGTQRKVLSDVTSLFRFIEDHDGVERAPIPHGFRPRRDPHTLANVSPDYLTDAEIAVVTALEEPYGFICRFDLASGLRWEEMVRALTAHLDRGALRVEDTKTGQRRVVPLPPALLAELATRVGRLCPFTEKASASFNASVKRRSGIARFHVRQLRHTYARLQVRAGVKPWVLQRLLGHASIKTTMLYVGADEALVREEMARLFGTESER